jgi:glutamine amidotransferase
MGRLIGYMSNRSDRLRDALHQERAAVATTPARADGWGLGFYQGGEVLHKKRPQTAGEALDWEDIAGDVRSHCVVAHLRQATVGDFRAENTHPFRMRQWLFAHNGTIDRFAALRAGLLEQLPDFLQRNVRGETDSELFFHTVLSFLHDAGQLDNPDIDDRHVLHALHASVALVDRLSAEVGGKPSTLNLVLTNGRKLYALRRGKPMAYVARQGLHDARDTADSARAEAEAAALRYVMVLSDGPAVAPGWQPLPEGHVLVVDRDLRTSTHAL